VKKEPRSGEERGIGVDKWLTQTNVIRVFSLLVGILLWVIVHLDEHVGDDPRSARDRVQDSWIYNLEVQVIGLDEERYRISSISPQTVNIVVRGTSANLAKISTRDGKSRIVADLSDVKPGRSSVRLQALGFPNGVDVVSIQPSAVEVVVEEFVRKEVPVRVIVEGEPKEGYMVGTPVVNPSRVYVTAAESALNRIAEAVVRVNVDGEDRTVAGEYQLVPVDEEGNAVNAVAMPATVRVEVPVTIPFKEVPLRLRLTGTPPDGYSLSSYRQSVDTVTVYAPEEVLKGIEYFEAAEINLSTLRESRKIVVDVPPARGVVSVLPSQVEVDVEIVPSVTRVFESVPIQVNGGHQDYEAVFVREEERTVSVTLEGSPDVMADLQANQIQAIVDISSLPPGRHVRNVTITLPMFVKLKSQLPEQVEVEIRQKTKDAAAPGDAPVGDEPAGETPPDGDAGGDNATDDVPTGGDGSGGSPANEG